MVQSQNFQNPAAFVQFTEKEIIGKSLKRQLMTTETDISSLLAWNISWRHAEWPSSGEVPPVLVCTPFLIRRKKAI